jgi:tetratricopeptide (TPR) repeat protein
MNNVKPLITGAAVLIILLAVLSVTVFNRHSPTMRLTALMREGRLAMDEGDYDAAIESYRLVIALSTRGINGYLALAAACEANGDYDDAIYFLRLGLKKTDNNEKLRLEYNRLTGLSEPVGTVEESPRQPGPPPDDPPEQPYEPEEENGGDGDEEEEENEDEDAEEIND